MIRNPEILALLIAAHGSLGEARLGSLLESLPDGETDADGHSLAALLKSVRPGRQLAAPAGRLADRLAATGSGALLRRHAGYPERLRLLWGDRAPAVLYVRGDETLFAEPSVAIIGTRRPTSAGREAAHSWASGLARGGWTVTSGNAPGIDAAAHQAALEAGGRTLVYPPVPLDAFEPSFDLASAPPGSVLIASPFVPGAPVDPWCFLRRNELVAAQAGASLVAETGTRGGTLNTVRHVSMLRRPLFVTDLPADSPRRRAHEMLAAGGARWIPAQCTAASLRTVLRAAERPLPDAGESGDLFSPVEFPT